MSVLFLSLLQACGGGGGEGSTEAAAEAPTPTTVAPVAGDLGAVSAKFAPTENARFLLLTTGRESNSRGPTEQADSGAMLRLGDNSLSGSHQTVDISGDAHFALGRWVKGVVTETSGTKTLEGKNQQSYHYLAFNRLTELPEEGELQCTAVAASAPTSPYGNNADAGSASGSASIKLGASGAVLQGELQVHAGTESATVKLSTTFSDPAYTHFTGQFLANGSGAMISLAEQDGDMPAFVVGYKSQLPGGATYIGTARFACTSK